MTLSEKFIPSTEKTPQFTSCLIASSIASLSIFPLKLFFASLPYYYLFPNMYSPPLILLPLFSFPCRRSRKFHSLHSIFIIIFKHKTIPFPSSCSYNFPSYVYVVSFSLMDYCLSIPLLVWTFVWEVRVSQDFSWSWTFCLGSISHSSHIILVSIAHTYI